MKLFPLLIIGLILLSGCISQASTPQPFTTESHKTDLKTECCNQCRVGASNDVRGMDISGQPCSYYKDRIVNGKNILTSECADYFEKTGLNIGECR